MMAVGHGADGDAAAPGARNGFTDRQLAGQESEAIAGIDQHRAGTLCADARRGVAEHPAGCHVTGVHRHTRQAM